MPNIFSHIPTETYGSKSFQTLAVAQVVVHVLVLNV